MEIKHHIKGRTASALIKALISRGILRPAHISQFLLFHIVGDHGLEFREIATSPGAKISGKMVCYKKITNHYFKKDNSD